jgi:NodT family efflux transporter outer membrane factor (OMF) lipoprotein
MRHPEGSEDIVATVPRRCGNPWRKPPACKPIPDSTDRRQPRGPRHCVPVIPLVFLALFALSLSGCMVGPNYADYVEPYEGLETAWNEQNTSLIQSGSGNVDLAWWTQFHDPTLNRLVETATNQNLGLQAAALRILESRAILGIAVGNIYPQSQTLGGNLLRNKRSGGGPDPYINSATFGFDAAWELDFWGKFRSAVDSADANLMADLANYDDILVSLTAEVATTYVNIRTLEERIRYALKNVELQEKSLKLVELQFEGGTVTKLDVLQAKTLMTNTKAQIPNMRASLVKYYNALAVLLGQTPGNIREQIAAGPIPKAPAQVGVGVPAELLRRRPDIRRAEMTAIAQCSQIGIAKADLYPSFALLGSLGSSATNAGTASLHNIFDYDNIYFTFGPSFRWNVLNYGRIKNNVRVQDARFEQTITNYHNTVLNAAREVEDAMTGFVQSKKEAEWVRQSMATSKESADLSMLQYKEGISDYQRVLDSIRSLTQTQDQYAVLQGNIATNLIAMYKALGGGWEIRDRTKMLPRHIKEKMKQRTDWGRMLDDPEPPMAPEKPATSTKK